MKESNYTDGKRESVKSVLAAWHDDDGGKYLKKWIWN